MDPNGRSDLRVVSLARIPKHLLTHKHKILYTLASSHLGQQTVTLQRDPTDVGSVLTLLARYSSLTVVSVALPCTKGHVMSTDSY